MITNIAIIIISVFIIGSAACSILFGEYCLNYKRFGVEFLIVAIALGVLGASLEPDMSLDLYRYYRLADTMVSYHDISVWLYSSINYLLTWRLLLGTSLLFNDTHAVPLFCVTLIFLFWYFILKECKKDSKLCYKEFFLYLIISIGIIGINNIFLMIRNELAFAIQFYALIRLLNNKTRKNIWIFIGLSIISLFLHPAVIIIIFCYFAMVVLQKGKVFQIIILMWSFIIGGLGNILIRVNLTFIRNIGGAIKTYAQFGVRNSGGIAQFVLYLSETAIVIFSLLVVMYLRKTDGLENNKLYDFMFIYCLFSVGSIGFEAVLNRLAFGCGFLAIPIVRDLIKKRTAMRMLLLFSYIIVAVGIYAFGYVMITSHTKIIYWERLFG